MYFAGGYWVVGTEGDGDTVEFPVLKVSDCASNPEDIDLDSVWYYQECDTCDMTTDGVGEVIKYTSYRFLHNKIHSKIHNNIHNKTHNKRHNKI